MVRRVVVAQHLDGAVVDLQGVVEGEFVLGQPRASPRCVGLAHLLGQLDQLLDDLGGLDGAVLVAAGSTSPASRRTSGPGRRSCATAVLISSFEQLAQQLDGEVRCGMSRTSARNSSERIEMSGFFSPAAAKMSMTSSDATALRDDLPDGVVDVLVGLALARRRSWRGPARTAWKKPTSSRMRERLVVRHREGERLRQLGHRLQQPVLAVLLREDVLLRGGQERQPLAAACRSSSLTSRSRGTRRSRFRTSPA